MDNKDMYRQVIMDHYKNPHNKVENDFDSTGYITREALNPSCGDMVKILAKLDGDKIIDIKFIGTGCSICCSSSSVMTIELNNLNRKQLIEKVNMFEQIIKDGDESNSEFFEDGQVFTGITDFPSRFKCAYLSWDTIKKLVEESNEGK